MINQHLKQLNTAGGVAKLKGQNTYMLVREVFFGTSMTVDRFNRTIMVLKEEDRVYHVHPGAYDMIVGEELFDFKQKGNATKVTVNEDRIKIIASVRKSKIVTSIPHGDGPDAPVGSYATVVRNSLSEPKKAQQTA